MTDQQGTKSSTPHPENPRENLSARELDEIVAKIAALRQHTKVTGFKTIKSQNQILGRLSSDDLAMVIMRLVGEVMTANSPRSFPFTETGNAERLVADHAADFRYLHDRQCWVYWDGRRWRVDDTAEIHRAAKNTVRGMYPMAANL